MIQTLKSLGHDQFEWARWAAKDYAHYKFMRVEVVSEDEKRWSTVLQNLITQSDSTVVRTSYQFPFEMRQHVFFRNRWWEIIGVREVVTEVASQALALVRGGNRQFVLEMVEVDGYDV